MRALSLLTLAAVLVTPAIADAAPSARWRQSWGLNSAATARVPTSPAFAKLNLEPRAGGHAAIATNLLAGPVQVRLHGQSAALQETLPSPALLMPGEQRTLLWLPADGGPTRLLLDAFPGDPAARPDDFVYQLPFRGQPVRVSQAFGGRYSHTDTQNLNAVDFPLAEGTPVLTARAGKVMQVVENAPDLGCLVRVLHRDGSMALYAHLQAGSLQVRPGQSVEAGQALAASGNTGNSTGPHLHFAIQANTGLTLTSLRFRMRSERGELQFPRETPEQPASR
ncbi:M23 family metallopeptidase [Stenotrophomonas sp. Iso1]|uniref:M23 family metallopeptidase n=1 Tax=Stenotrophomonas sp. Iso1 TaxID=2977283 RepID=UPI0022B7D054|nr:M23 family metallopeptidase [Stenotrophomonas sp. Iso1]